MARGGLYKSEVRKARDSLLVQGKHPSVDALRVALGNTGSKTTIHRYLKELEAEEDQAPGAKVGVSDALQDLVTKLAARLHEEAEATIAAAKAESDEAVRVANSVLDAQRKESRSVSEQLQQAELALQTERVLHDETKAALAASRVKIAQLEERVGGLTTQLTEREAHTASLEDKHRQAREALEHFRASAKEQREQELRRHDHALQELQLELRKAAETMAGKNQELLQLNRDNGRLAQHQAQLERDVRGLRDGLRDAELRTAQHSAIVGENAELQHRCAALLADNSRLNDELARALGAIETECAARKEADTARERLEGRVQALDEILAGTPKRRARRQSAGTS